MIAPVKRSGGTPTVPAPFQMTTVADSKIISRRGREAARLAPPPAHVMPSALLNPRDPASPISGFRLSMQGA
ncbi:unnamed protein product [Cutaneotrichosporon oleaginosum]